ncbi:pyruvate/2-oxoglutarate dehydrogenase complex [Cereibacter sphaeroides]|uniref:pyruvate/2-oxoglutarate dehydrogenase complex n=1 Tax=Cereibacter sphaeroides TaxID=1063 RepID=UPI001F2638A3|nr:pyruvate/2-oxoglutarate dehydrogenase complex [Cereibacter sphaeroides]MCE6968728.1 pyruvate/2-oxoglutarate dehydrogenase complex [Cereibacter sphaeroides]
MPRTLLPLVATLLVLVSCADMREASVPAADEVARLKSLGFVPFASAGQTQVLRYSGPVTPAVLCRSGAGGYAALPARRQLADGTSQRIELDAYLQLTPGEDGTLAASGRRGVYAVSILTQPPGSRRTGEVEIITFEPGGSGTSRSGLTCRPA